jgi:phospholipid/cholesterol/gamma-HCH transport system ATP-binding protein
VLFQQGALFSALTVYDNIALPLRELGTVDEGLIRELVLLKLEMVGIEAGHATKMPSDLSGGMVKRVALARALALEPELLFLDEPTAGLDPDRSESFVQLIEDLRLELELTVVMVTHDLDTLISLSSRVAVLCDQRIVAIGALAEVVKSSHRFITNFFQGERGKRALLVLSEALVK